MLGRVSEMKRSEDPTPAGDGRRRGRVTRGIPPPVLGDGLVMDLFSCFFCGDPFVLSCVVINLRLCNGGVESKMRVKHLFPITRV